MRLIIILLVVSIMQVSASSYAQKISISKKNASLENIFDDIHKQSGYFFLFNRDLLKNANPVTIEIKDGSLQNVLNQCFAGQPFTFTLEDKTVVVKPKEESFLSKITAIISNINVRGTVFDSLSRPLMNASVKIKGTNIQVVTGHKGEFDLPNVDENTTLIVSFIGYQTREVKVSKSMMIYLSVLVTKLNDVVIASNGYQDIPKERATGSFEVITAKQLQHSVSGNLLQRLEGITTSVVFNNTTSPTNSAANVATRNPQTGNGLSPQSYNGGGYTIDNMTIRGKNTLSANGSGNPLVVIDGIASPYDISLINPDDVVSVTILKDAAAASIWGSRAGNGVLVIKTKRGEFNRGTVVSFNGNFSVTEKPDLFYLKQMTTSDFIDAEIYGFQQSKKVLPAPSLTNAGSISLATPVTEILDAINKGTISSAAGNAQIDALRSNDIRNDQLKYLLRNAISQNYSLNISGGSKTIAYNAAGGYQNVINNTVKSNSDRYNISYNMQLKPFKNMEITSGIAYFITDKSGIGSLSIIPPFSGLSGYSPYYFPYSRLADDQGNAAAISIYRPGFLTLVNNTYGSKILDYTYKPLDDLNESYSKATNKTLNFNVALNYRFSSLLSAQVTYNYGQNNLNTTDYYSGQSFYMRDLINKFTNPVTFVRAIPVGGFYKPGSSSANNQTLRGLLSFNKDWNKHNLNAIIGAEGFDLNSTSNPTYGYYGYNPTTLTGGSVIYYTNFNTLFNPNFSTSSPIPNSPGISFIGYRSRTLSEFLNAAYTYDHRYTISGSIRKDGSSAFGDNTNKTGTPFYSAGASWNINAEKFYNISWLPTLKLRSTFGYNGNSNPGALSYATITTSTIVNVFTNLPYASINNISNLDLRPERTAITNIALEFGFKNNRLTGSLEYYIKNTKDLLSNTPLDPTLGYTSAVYNAGDLKGDGFDLRLRSDNLRAGAFTWVSNFNGSYNRTKVTKNYVAGNIGATTILQNTTYFLEGQDLSTIYAYKWAGLNPITGAARAYFATGVITESDTKATYPDLLSIGSAVPVYYGNIANTFSYRGWSLWANVICKLGYYARRPASTLFLNSFQMSTSGPQQVAGIEYENRWQKPGDEAFTNVPSRNITRGTSNDYLYQYADINVYKADNIRLQEVNLSHVFKSNSKLIKNPRIYINVPLNIILWKANKLGLDPDIYDYQVPKTYSFGFSANF